MSGISFFLYFFFLFGGLLYKGLKERVKAAHSVRVCVCVWRLHDQKFIDFFFIIYKNYLRLSKNNNIYAILVKFSSHWIWNSLNT